MVQQLIDLEQIPGWFLSKEHLHQQVEAPVYQKRAPVPQVALPPPTGMHDLASVLWIPVCYAAV
jgi:hypothetical protein